MLIGLTGAAFSGKDTTGRYLHKHHQFFSKAFADPLRDCLRIMFGLTDWHFLPEHKEEKIEWIGKSPRKLLQSLGTEWGRDQVARNLWVRHMARRVQPILNGGGDVVITDVRFLDEAELIHRFGGQIWRVIRKEGQKTKHADHTSEQESKRIIADVDIENFGTLEQLYERIDEALRFEIEHGETHERRRIGL